MSVLQGLQVGFEGGLLGAVVDNRFGGHVFEPETLWIIMLHGFCPDSSR